MNRRLVGLLLAVPLAVTAFPTPLFAHVRWFASGAFADVRFPVDTATVLIALGAVLFGAAGILIERSHVFDRISTGLATVAEEWQGFDWRLIGALTGVMLIGNATQSVYLAPNIELPLESLAVVGAWAQVLVGLLLLFQVTFSVSGALVLLVAILSLTVVSPAIMVDYVFEFVALAIALVFIGPAYCWLDRRLYERLGLDPQRVRGLAVPVIRVGVGLTLITLAIHNKLLHPGVTMAFLEEYHYNFMPMLGFAGFSDLHFTFAAGVGELTLGLLILLGIATRFVVVTLTGFFVTTLILLGPIELLGHLPLFGVAIMLILRGPGVWAVGQEAVARWPLWSALRGYPSRRPSVLAFREGSVKTRQRQELLHLSR